MKWEKERGLGSVADGHCAIPFDNDRVSNSSGIADSMRTYG